MKKNILLSVFLMTIIYVNSQSGDKDKDGILDNVDKCPNVPGIALKRGCPELSKKNIIICNFRSVLEEFERVVYFNSNESILTDEALVQLNLIVKIMEEYRESIFDITGYAFNNEKQNKLLSEKRSKAVKDYFLSKGIVSSRLFIAVYSKEDSKPLETPNGGVEIKLRK